ncbi:hypothetical protein EDD17DRAFT_1671616 [Pisolithus thermaeus]|nr:hypothetical protein EDD17DRAFT_1671616 [Pisolithus thermaeus]
MPSNVLFILFLISPCVSSFTFVARKGVCIHVDRVSSPSGQHKMWLCSPVNPWQDAVPSDAYQMKLHRGFSP